MRPVLTIAVVIVVAASGCRHASDRPETPASPAAALTLVEAPTPRFPVRGFETRGTYPQVSGGGVDLRAVNAALRDAVLADQREYARLARTWRARISRDSIYFDNPGLYRTSVDRARASASTVVVSALMPATRDLAGTHKGDGWLGVTIEVPSGRRVRISDLFADSRTGLLVLAREWKRRIGHPVCGRIYAEADTPTAGHDEQFALTASGIAVGAHEFGACGQMVATVPYDVVRPHLSARGRRLVDGVRAPL